MAEHIRIINLTTGYKQKYGIKRVSRGLNLMIRDSELVILIGPNGCGKSTLMNTLSRLLKPVDGDVHINNLSIEKIKPKNMAKLLSLVLTDRIYAPQLRVKEVIEIGRYPYVGQLGIISEKDEVIVKEAIKQCHLVGYESCFYTQLSDGEKQRVMIARALAQQTPVMLLDEPTAHLDLPSRLEVIIMLRKLSEECGKSILLSTHELDLALQWADTIWLMDKDGQVFHGAPEDLILNGAIEKVFGNENLLFDKERGEFSVLRSKKTPISIIGHGLRLEWTLRALERKGYNPTVAHSNEAHIRVLKDSWMYEGNEYPSIRELLRELNKKS